MNLCRIEGCANAAGVPGSARGLCRAHYRRWQRYGDENEPVRRLRSYAGDTCSELGCEAEARINGLCLNDYAVARRRHDPEGQRRRNLAFRERHRANQEALMGRPRPDLCEMCGEPPIGRGKKSEAGICFDHDHTTGKPRGWLCDRCNKVLGLIRDDPALLERMADYLRFHAGVPAEAA